MNKSFIILSFCWLIIINSVILMYLPNSPSNLITGASIIDSTFSQTIKGISFSLIILNISTILLLGYIYSKFQEKKKIKFKV